jgi:branched-chain amino acid transport system substrate-binding protein
MKRLRRFSSRALPALAVGALAAVAVAACGSSSGGSASTGDGGGGASGGRSLACKDKKLVVGIAKAESGGSSFFDVAGTNGLKVAIDEVNAKGGIKGCKIETISGDTKSDPAVAAQVARSLIDKGAQILFVPDDFDLGIAAAKVGQKAGVLTLSTAASSTQFAKAVGNLFFSAGITTTQLGNAQARYALDQGWKSAYQALDPGLAYFTEQDTTFRAVYEPGGGKVVGTDKVDSLSGQSDYSSTISKIKAAKPDVIQALMVFPAVGTFVKQLRAAGVDTPVTGNVTLDTRELPKLVGTKGSSNIAYAVQVYFNGAGTDAKTDPGIVTFTEAYQEKFGHFPEQANAPESYQTFLAVSEALSKPEVKDASSAAAAIRAQTGVAVPGGSLVKWQDGYAIWDPHIVGIENGRFTDRATYKASELTAGK